MPLVRVPYINSLCRVINVIQPVVVARAAAGAGALALSRSVPASGHLHVWVRLPAQAQQPVAHHLAEVRAGVGGHCSLYSWRRGRVWVWGRRGGALWPGRQDTQVQGSGVGRRRGALRLPEQGHHLQLEYRGPAGVDQYRQDEYEGSGELRPRDHQHPVHVFRQDRAPGVRMLRQQQAARGAGVDHSQPHPADIQEHRGGLPVVRVAPQRGHLPGERVPEQPQQADLLCQPRADSPEVLLHHGLRRGVDGAVLHLRGQAQSPAGEADILRGHAGPAGSIHQQRGHHESGYRKQAAGNSPHQKSQEVRAAAQLRAGLAQVSQVQHPQLQNPQRAQAQGQQHRHVYSAAVLVLAPQAGRRVGQR